ncbi:MAG TPA: SDR family oxidoreductase [Acidimicrobiales bacterium]|jgi:3-oxoacyl-[acyl-carrier protein] reductase|nr:SDR family oxidoreductase [Acidimicrobiales bacterium]
MPSEPRGAALVTGASRGIGRALAGRLADEGFDLTITGRDLNALEDVADELRRRGRAIITVAADMAAEEQVHEVVIRHQYAYHRLDVLVIGAGVGTAGEIEKYPLPRLDKQVAVNLRAPFQLVSECLPLLRQAAAQSPEHGAKIFALASIAGVVAEPRMAAYNASKAALISLCETVNLEASIHGVTATAISPAYVDTELTAWLHDEVPQDSMISVEDISELFTALLRLSPKAVVPNIVIGRAGPTLWRA